MRFTKKQVNVIVSKKMKNSHSKAVAHAILFGTVFGIIFTSCYILNKDVVNDFWSKQYNGLIHSIK